LVEQVPQRDGVLQAAHRFIEITETSGVSLMSADDSDPRDSTGSTAPLPDELIAKLDELAEQPGPEDLKLGARCYRRAAPPNREEYICPTCGERTLYAKWGACGKVRDVRAASDIAKRLTQHGLVLDEATFCKHCSPDAAAPQIVLLTRYADGTEHRVQDVTSSDLQLIEEFFAGHGKHDRGMGGEEPLKQHLERIAQLLLPPDVFAEYRRERSTAKKLAGAIKKVFGGDGAGSND
jgi:hypothetical protein